MGKIDIDLHKANNGGTYVNDRFLKEFKDFLKNT